MENALRFICIVSAVILGIALLKQFNTETFTFEKPALAAVYTIAFVVAIILLFKNTKRATEK